jgi:hypothetical protein
VGRRRTGAAQSAAIKPHASNSFLGRRWRGEVPLRTVFWRDMWVVGTATNVLATLIALAAASQGASSWVAASIHFAPLPYNVFLVIAVWRARPPSPTATLVALTWLAVMTVV